MYVHTYLFNIKLLQSHYYQSAVPTTSYFIHQWKYILMFPHNALNSNKLTTILLLPITTARFPVMSTPVFSMSVRQPTGVQGNMAVPTFPLARAPKLQSDSPSTSLCTEMEFVHLAASMGEVVSSGSWRIIPLTALSL